MLESAKLMPISPSNVMNDGAEDALIVKINADGEEKIVTLIWW